MAAVKHGAEMAAQNSTARKWRRKTPFALAALALSSLAAFFAAPPLAAKDGAFYFVQITDTHHGRTLHQARFAQAIAQINALPYPVDIVAHTGDFASDNLERNAAAISNMLATITKAPLVCVPGNHDLSERGENPRKRLADCLDAYQRHIGALGTALETTNALYVAVCTEGLTRDISHATDFDPVAFVRGALAANKSGKPAFVFTHIPDGSDFYNGAEHPSRYKRRGEWREALADGKVAAVVAGHFHRDELQNDEYGVPVFVAPPIASFWGRQGVFRIYKYEGGRLSYRTVYIEDEAPAASE